MMSSLPLFIRSHRLVSSLLLAMLLLLALLIGDEWALLMLAASALLAFVAWRDAPRSVPTLAGAVLAPADGRVVRIDKARDPYADRDALRISVFMNVFDGHANRASVDGVIRQVQYFPGALVNPDLDVASRRNERNAVVIESHGQLVTLVQVAGLVARRILCHVKPGDTLTRGQRYGGIRFGSRVDIYLPPHAIPKVAPGERVSATTTILATLAPA